MLIVFLFASPELHPKFSLHKKKAGISYFSGRRLGLDLAREVNYLIMISVLFTLQDVYLIFSPRKKEHIFLALSGTHKSSSIFIHPKSKLGN